MRKLEKLLLTGTMLSAFVSPAAIEIATADPVRLAAAACPQGQVGTPPNCKPAPPAPKPAPPPPPPHPAPPPPHAAPPPPPHPAPPPPPHPAPPVQRPVQPQVQHPQPPQVPRQPVQQQQQPPRHVPPPQQTQQPLRPQQPNVTTQPNPQIQPSPQPNPQIQRSQQPNIPTQPPVQPRVQTAPVTTHMRPPPPPTLPPPSAAQATPLQRVTGPAALVPTTPQGQPIHSVTQLRTERRQSVVGGNTVFTEGNRVIVRQNNGAIIVRHDDVDRFRYGARDVRVERRGNNNVTTVVLGNGVRVVTELGPDGRIMRRSRFDRDGREVVIIAAAVAVGVGLFVELAPPVLRIPRERYIVDMESAPPDYVYGAFAAPPVEQIDQAYSLDQVLDSPSLRDLMPSVDLDTITFETGSWEIGPDQVDRLSVVADGINRVLQANPKEVFLVEGHTDAVGSDVDNMSLSDRRAETVALILSDKFGVPPENLVSQGYGSQFLRVPTQGPERRNRRVTVRRITPLLAGR